MRWMRVATSLVGAAMLAGAASATPNLLKNSDFGASASKAMHSILTGNSMTGDASASSWTVYNNGPGSTTTALLPSTRRPKGWMIHIVTTNSKTNSGSGIVQAFLPVSTGPGHVIASAWIYINRGVVFIGTGNGGNTGIDARVTTTKKWIDVRARNGVSPANLFIIYGQSPGADFDVDEASVEAIAPGQSPVFGVTKAYLEADPVEYVGHCPTTIRFYGTITGNGPGEVLYTFQRSDGSYVAEPKLSYYDVGSRAVQMSWTVGNYYSPQKQYDEWAQIKVTSPSAFVSNKAKFSITCKNT